MEIKANHRQEKKSPRDFRPWELLDFLPVGCFLYHQAARQIADSLDWDDYKLEALLGDMAEAINAKALPTVSRQTGLRVPKNSEPEFLGVVTVDDVNAWLISRGATYRWMPLGKTSEPQTGPAQDAITPVPEVAARKQRRKRPTWRDVALPYVVDVFRAGNFTTAKALYVAIEKKAGPDSPFERGSGDNRAKLVVRELSKSVSMKTIQNAWDDIKERK